MEYWIGSNNSTYEVSGLLKLFCEKLFQLFSFFNNNSTEDGVVKIIIINNKQILIKIIKNWLFLGKILQECIDV